MHSTDGVVAEAGTSAMMSHAQGTCQLWIRCFVVFAVYACDGHMITWLRTVLRTLPDLDLHLMIPLHAIENATPYNRAAHSMDTQKQVCRLNQGSSFVSQTLCLLTKHKLILTHNKTPQSGTPW